MKLRSRKTHLKSHFSQRIVLVYTAIVVVPILFLFILVMSFSARGTLSSLWSQCQLETDTNSRILNENLVNMKLVETMVKANSDLRLFLTSPQNKTEAEIISTVKSEITTLERVLSVIPSMYSIRIFTDSDRIPERFPVILHTDRTDLEKLDEWEYNYVAEFMGSASSQVLPSACYTQKLMNYRQEIAWLQLAMKMSDFVPFLYRKEAQFHNDYAFRIIQDENGVKSLSPIQNSDILARNAPLSQKDLKKLEGILFHEKGDKGRMVAGHFSNKRYITWSVIPEIDFVVVHSCNTDLVSPSIMFFVLMAVLGMIITAIGVYLLITYLTKRMLSGVYSIIDGMREVRNGNYSVQIPVTYSDEIGESQKTFNSMTDQLTRQIEQIKIEQQLIADTEMKAMQNQINAHFLYNVLETIHMQAVISENKDAAESILVLGKMMRYVLRWRVHTVTLSQEMEYISSYVYILNIRNDYKITLETDIPEKYIDMTIPKMMVQPFVENSFTHGIEPNAKDAVIRVFVQEDLEHGRLWLCEQDFGCGMSEEKVKEIMDYLADDEYERDSKGSIGIKNIQQRLSMFYGKDFRLEIHSKEGEGTLIRVPIPLEGEIKE